MSEPRWYRFDEKLKESEGVCEAASIEAIALGNISGSISVSKANESDDRNGTDWWVHCTSGAKLSVDAKVRSVDWSRRGCDDLALETLSVVEKGVIGWTLNQSFGYGKTLADGV
jgi:hypothetical protein